MWREDRLFEVHMIGLGGFLAAVLGKNSKEVLDHSYSMAGILRTVILKKTMANREAS